MPFYCQYCVFFCQCVCLKMDKNQYQSNLRYTGGHVWLVSVHLHIAEIRFTQ